MRLILIRHGATNYSLENKYCGFTDPPLCDEGISQAQMLSGALKEYMPDRIYSSDLKRAWQTAEIVFRESPIEKVSDFREMNFGLFEGLRHEEIIKENLELYRKWIDNPEKIKPPDGETLENLSKRVNERLKLILSQDDNKTIAIVTHGGPIKVILLKVLASNLNEFWQIKQDLAAFNIIEYLNNGSSELVKANEVSHLSS